MVRRIGAGALILFKINYLHPKCDFRSQLAEYFKTFQSIWAWLLERWRPNSGWIIEHWCRGPTSGLIQTLRLAAISVERLSQLPQVNVGCLNGCRTLDCRRLRRWLHRPPVMGRSEERRVGK